MNEKAVLLTKKSSYGFADLVSIMELLRSEDGCPWDKVQTHESIRKNLIEETYEAVDAIDKGDLLLLKEELGDVLLQVVFHARMEEEEGNFNIDDVCNDICKKLIVRHPHIFGEVIAEDAETVLTNWEEIKKQTKGMKNQSESLMDLPKCLPSLVRATKIQSRAKKVGFDFDSVEGAIEKVDEEIAELKAAILNGTQEDREEELGDLLFAVTNVSRFIDADAEEALYKANEKFINRFKIMEELALKENKNLKDMTLSEMDKLWDKAKLGE